MSTREEILSVSQSGIAFRRAGQPGEALRCMTQACDVCGPDQSDERAHVLRELGELARDSHDLSAAQAHYEQAVALLRPSEDRLKFAHTIRHLGDIHTEPQHWSEAERCLGEALDIYRSHPSSAALDRANAIRAYAVLKTQTGKREEARALWAEAGQLYELAGVVERVEECRRQG